MVEHCRRLPGSFALSIYLDLTSPALSALIFRALREATPTASTTPVIPVVLDMSGPIRWVGLTMGLHAYRSARSGNV
jgi:hypothetical protein